MINIKNKGYGVYPLSFTSDHYYCMKTSELFLNKTHNHEKGEV